MMLALILAAVTARPGPSFVTTTTTQDPNTPACTVAETFVGLDETTHNPQFCPAYNKNCRNMYETTAVGGTACHYACTPYLHMHWCYTEECVAGQPCSWGWCMKNTEQNCPLEAPPIPEDETCPFICSAYAGVPDQQDNCGGPDVLEVHAECAKVFLPSVRKYDESVPYIVNPEKNKGRGSEAGAAWFNFKCCEDVENFEVEMDVLMIGGGANSFWLFVDDTRKQFGWRKFSTEWQWAIPPMTWQIKAGCHNFIVDDREPGTKFRAVRLIGEAAEKCHWSAHTADGDNDAEVAVASGPGWDATTSAAFRAWPAPVEEKAFTPEDIAIYSFATIGVSSLLYYSFRALLGSKKNYTPITDVEHPQYSA